MEESFNLCHLVLANSGPFGNNFVKDLKTTLIQPAGGAGCHNRVLKVLMYICLLKILLPIDIVISYNGSVEKKAGKAAKWSVLVNVLDRRQVRATIIKSLTMEPFSSSLRIQRQRNCENTFGPKETGYLWGIWSGWWGNMTWPTKRQMKHWTFSIPAMF